MILHITSLKDWNEGQQNGEFRVGSLAAEGFIHASLLEQIKDVANFLFKGRKGLVVLVIDEDKVLAEIKYEDGGDGKLYPRIYGPINLDAVIKVVEFRPGEDGSFEMPNLNRFLSSE